MNHSEETRKALKDFRISTAIILAQQGCTCLGIFMVDDLSHAIEKMETTLHIDKAFDINNAAALTLLRRSRIKNAEAILAGFVAEFADQDGP